jgi:hypothetical protein
MEKSGLMADKEFPMSRDWGRDDIPCSRTTCISNRSRMCILPSRCEIGEDGHCMGYIPVGCVKPEDETRKDP